MLKIASGRNLYDVFLKDQAFRMLNSSFLNVEQNRHDAAKNGSEEGLKWDKYLSRNLCPSYSISKQWIAAGQKAGFIPRSVDAGKTAELFVLISLGLRVRSFISSGDYAFASAEFAKLMAEMLRPSNHQSG